MRRKGTKSEAPPPDGQDAEERQIFASGSKGP